MSNETPQNDELWSAIGREVSKRASAAPKVPYQAVETPRRDIDRVLVACLSGYLPVLALCLAWTVVFCWNWQLLRLISWRTILMGLWAGAASWAVYPVLWKDGGLRAYRLIPLGVALIWTLPLAELLCAALPGENLRGAWHHLDSDLWLGTHQWTLLVMIPLWMALAKVLQKLQRQYPWYDPAPPRRNRVRVAAATLLLPFGVNVVAALALHLSVSPATAAWEQEVVARQGRLGERQDSPWVALAKEADQLHAGSTSQQVQDLEAAALGLLESQPPQPGDRWRAEGVFQDLLRRRADLTNPVLSQAALLECDLRGMTYPDLDAFDYAMNTFLDSDTATQEQLESMASVMRRLSALRSSAVDKRDHDLYSKRFLTRDYVVTSSHWLSPVMADYLPTSLLGLAGTNADLETWLAQRSALSQSQKGEGGLAELEARLSLYELLCKLRAYRLETGVYPGSLAMLGMDSEEALARYEYTGKGSEAVLVDSETVRLAHRRSGPRAEWALK